VRNGRAGDPNNHAARPVYSRPAALVVEQPRPRSINEWIDAVDLVLLPPPVLSRARDGQARGQLASNAAGVR